MKRRDFFTLLAATPAAWCVSKLGLAHVKAPSVQGFILDYGYVPDPSSRWLASMDYYFPGTRFAMLIESRPDGVMVVHETNTSKPHEPVDLRLPKGVRAEDVEIVHPWSPQRKMLPPSPSES